LVAGRNISLNSANVFNLVALSFSLRFSRSHRIGQTRNVHIYRLITRHTIEENILKKANQKRELDDLVIQGGCFTTEFFKSLDPRALVTGAPSAANGAPSSSSTTTTTAIDMAPPDAAAWERAVAAADDAADAVALREARRELVINASEFVDPSQVSFFRVTLSLFRLVRSSITEVCLACLGWRSDCNRCHESNDIYDVDRRLGGDERCKQRRIRIGYRDARRYHLTLLYFRM
jgi:hypothetical protein